MWYKTLLATSSIYNVSNHENNNKKQYLGGPKKLITFSWRVNGGIITFPGVQVNHTTLNNVEIFKSRYSCAGCRCLQRFKHRSQWGSSCSCVFAPWYLDNLLYHSWKPPVYDIDAHSFVLSLPTPNIMAALGQTSSLEAKVCSDSVHYSGMYLMSEFSEVNLRNFIWSLRWICTVDQQETLLIVLTLRRIVQNDVSWESIVPGFWPNHSGFGPIGVLWGTTTGSYRCDDCKRSNCSLDKWQLLKRLA